MTLVDSGYGIFWESYVSPRNSSLPKLFCAAIITVHQWLYPENWLYTNQPSNLQSHDHCLVVCQSTHQCPCSPTGPGNDGTVSLLGPSD